jgi:hypothetical protein
MEDQVDDRSGEAQNGEERPPADAVWSRPEKHVSLQTVERLSVYRRALEELDREGVEYVHSQKLADLVNAPAGCFVEHTDITAKLELLSFLVRSSGEQPDDEARPPETLGGAAV